MFSSQVPLMDAKSCCPRELSSPLMPDSGNSVARPYAAANSKPAKAVPSM